MSSKITVAKEINPRFVEIGAVVTRCGCGDADSHNGTRCVHGPEASCSLCPRPCPQPRSVEDRGLVAHYYRNPFRRAFEWARRRLKGA